ncbi:Detected protein of confused Function [Hibiscus syriacus]|uniref:Detected protein of confused Function n=1 Tax=Hibiscus syriacus TaxID=106335 RepID=A0A6A3BCB9_HIBSY|nr:TBC1 domain family member 13-like [Hibiscus syriacus]KAE8714544.1 Detected protein of confused Function [Hibiscus syriacus]
MARKRVPDWLNSSLWSTTPADDRLHIYSPSPTTATTTDSAVFSEPTPQPSAPVPPPPAAAAASKRQSTPILSKSETGDPVNKNSNHNSGGNDQNDGSSGSSPNDISRQAQLLSELSKKVINMWGLRRFASQGIPDGAGIRSTVWKLLLGYLPPERGQWSSELAKKRSQYRHFKEELLMNPSEITWRLEKSVACDNDESNSESKGLLSRSHITHGEHPLSLGKSSVWNQFFQESEIVEQIDRDVMRTHPDMHFFSGDLQLAKSNQDAMRNILIVFAKLNPGIRYVQGMNEILAPLFYVFKNDPDAEMAAAAEADTFFCFVELLSGFRDHFCQQLDNSNVGIRSTISRLSQLLKEHDEELWRHLEITTKVNPSFYAFRWITLLLTQEFNFADSLHIWDTLLSDPEGPLETLLRVCCAMLILIRRRLLAGDFTSNLKLLQNYPSANISHLLYIANKLRTQAIG